MRHGLYTTYVNDRCRCDACKLANTINARKRRKAIAYGRGEVFVPIGPARDHLKALMAKGWSVGKLTEASGVGRHNITSALYGHYEKISATTLAMILALEDSGDRNFKSVDNRGVRRRCEALQALGFSLNFQAKYLGVHIQNLFHIVNHDSCARETVERVSKMYDALAWTKPNPKTQQDKAGVTKAINKAKKFGYAPPAAWDDIDTDLEPVKVERDPDFVDPLKLEIRLAGGKVRFNRAESYAATFELAARGMDQVEISNWLFITQSAVNKRLSRATTQHRDRIKG